MMFRQCRTPRLLRRLNAQRVLDVARAGDLLRVTELVAQTGLSRPTVDAVADDLIGLGWLEEVAAETPRRGRPARSLRFRADAGYVAGLDIGEVKVRAAVADLRGEVVAERVREFAGEERLPEIRRTAAATLKDAGISRDGAARVVRRLHRRDEHADAGACCSAASSPRASTSPARSRASSRARSSSRTTATWP